MWKIMFQIWEWYRNYQKELQVGSPRTFTGGRLMHHIGNNCEAAYMYLDQLVWSVNVRANQLMIEEQGIRYPVNIENGSLKFEELQVAELDNVQLTEEHAEEGNENIRSIKEETSKMLPTLTHSLINY
jgi:hypothetical protein